MGRRSDFARVPHDLYRTIDPRVVAALAPFVDPDQTFAEPCVGQGDLMYALEAVGLQCDYSDDLPTDALQLTADDVESCELIITNPPWTRSLLHQMIEHFSGLRPTWLLFDAPWMHTAQSAPYMRYCRAIVSVGRLIWIPGTTMSGKDDCCWYLFDRQQVLGRGPIFYGRKHDELELSALQQAAE